MTATDATQRLIDARRARSQLTWPRRPEWLSVPAAQPGPEGVCPEAGAAYRCVVFVADHGSAAHAAGAASLPAHGASDLAAEVLAETGIGSRGAGNASVEIIELGRHRDAPPFAGSLALPLGPGTTDHRIGPAMTRHQLDLALSAGRHAAERARLDGAELLIAAGRGTGSEQTTELLALLLSRAEPERGREPVDTIAPPSRGLATAATAAPVPAAGLDDPYELLRRIGGFEHAALAGAALAAAQLGLPAIAANRAARIGFTLAAALNPGSACWLDTARSTQPSLPRPIPDSEHRAAHRR